MKTNLLIYIGLMIVVTNLIRVLPMILIRKQIKQPFLRSFLYYVPYVTLAVMTFPAIMEATSNAMAGLLALILGIFAAWKNWGLFPVAILCCVVVFCCEMFV